MDSIISDVVPPLLQALADHIRSSCSLHNKVGSLEAEMEVAELALQAVQACTTQTLVRLRNRQNELSPMHRLPNELLGAIFVLVGASGRNAPFSVSQVCKLWREIALNTPHLWTNVNVLAGPNLAFMYAERSGAAPLDLSVSIETPSSHIDEARAIYWSRYADRWGSLKIRCSVQPATLEDSGVLLWLTRPAPVLESLEISTNSEFGWQVSPGISPDIQMPCLRKIKLFGFHLPLTLPIFRGLTIIHLSRIVYSATELHRALVECPMLEEFRVSGALRANATSDQDEPDRFTPQIIELSHLRHLSFSCIPTRMIQYLLTHIATPPRSTLDIVLSRLLPEECLEDTFPLNPAHLSNLSSVVSLEFFAFAGGTMCQVRGKDSTEAHLLSISAYGELGNWPIRKIMTSLGPSLSIMPVQNFTLRSYANRRWSASTLCRTLEYFPSIRVLGFGGCHEKFLKALTRPTGRCPSLETLRISDCAISNRALSHLVWSRTAHNKDISSNMAHLKEVQLFGPLYADTVPALSPYVEASWDPESLSPKCY
ncbi:hypothetical protein BOTBODRAFT_31265 [Botryobasidium botryosum FD-172 SS1]|uniref:F-box domain-containing protein n=1 Tax=Botryobasidium botryosum (strain FD-172 SS1) TaxID=930990 RepID=A0A067MJ39_BOTB1|nr:hypothetical protein BOTBODRAFT_31265 [Botryobasidium botryosum FD-172 SS1]